MRSRYLLCLVVLVLLSTTAAAADGFSVEITTLDGEARPASDDVARFAINITNTAQEVRSYRASYLTGTATSPSWYSLDPAGGWVYDLQPDETRTVTMTVRPSNDAVSGSQGPEVYVYQGGDPNNRYSELVTFQVVRDQPIVMTGFRAPAAEYSPGDNITVSMTAMNVVQQDRSANSYQLTVSFAGEEYTVPGPSLDPGEAERLSVTIPVVDIRAGEYTLDAYLMSSSGQVFQKQSATVRVLGEPDVETVRSVDDGLVSGSYTVTKRNMGNEIAEGVRISERVPWYKEPFVSVSPAPMAQEAYSGGTEYVWSQAMLDPGESFSATVSYSYYMLVLLALVLAAAGFLLYRRFMTVRVVKVVRRTADGGISVHVRVKNRTGRTISGVELEDFVPGIAELQEEFDARRPDQVRHTDDGTSLLWRLGALDPDEERIMTYRLTPRVEVEGRVSLPEAEVSYEQRNEEHTVSSHPVSVDFT